MVKELVFGKYINNLRCNKGLTLKYVSDRLGIDISLLSKNEHGERQIQIYMLSEIAVIFDLDFRALQIEFISQCVKNEFGNELFFKDAIVLMAIDLKKYSRV